MPNSQRSEDRHKPKTSETATSHERLDVMATDPATRDQDWRSASEKQAKGAAVGVGKKAQVAGKSALAGVTRGQQERVASPADLEKAHPHGEAKFSKPEPQEARGAPGSRESTGETDRPREGSSPEDWTGVGLLGPADEGMPTLQPGR